MLLQDVTKWRLPDGRSLGSFRFILDGAVLMAQCTRHRSGKVPSQRSLLLAVIVLARFAHERGELSDWNFVR